MYKNSYADVDCDLNSLLHGIARLHVALGRMETSGISTRGWSYNDLVNGILSINVTKDISIKQERCIDCLFDTLEGIIEIGPNAVSYLADLQK